MIIDSYTTQGADSWTCPAGVTTVKVVVIGGGGAAGKHDGGGGGGGQGGQCVIANAYSVTPSNSYSLYVGAGGNDYGVDGEQSWFDGSTVIADKGYGAIGYTGGYGAQTGQAYDVEYQGGTGGDGQQASFHDGGAGGGAAGDSACGQAGFGYTGGNGGVGTWVSGGPGGGGDQYPVFGGSDGNSPGGGGGGSEDDGTGYWGAAGGVYLIYNPPGFVTNFTFLSPVGGISTGSFMYK